MPGAYRIDVLLNCISEAAGVALMDQIAGLLVENGLATREHAGEVRAIVALREHVWTGELDPPGALRVIAPKAVPRSPDLGLGYSPN